MKTTTNEKALKNGLKEVENLGVLAPALLRERLISLIEMNISQIKRNPEPYNTPVTSSKMYLDVLGTFLQEIEFKTP